MEQEIKTIMFIKTGKDAKNYVLHYGTNGFSFTQEDYKVFEKQFIKLLNKFNKRLKPAKEVQRG